MSKLDPVDILGAAAKKGQSAGSVVVREPKAVKAKRAGASKPSPYETDLRAKLRDKVQFNVGKLPRFVSDIYESQAKDAGMNKREFFYHLLRERGGDIPAYKDMDARKL